jgi:hypothetical protein
MLNVFIIKNIKIIELIGVIMRIISFSLVSWLGPKSPFLFVWTFNTADAVILSWCAILKKDSAYTLLNCFWVIVGLVGILRTIQII